MSSSPLLPLPGSRFRPKRESHRPLQITEVTPEVVQYRWDGDEELRAVRRDQWARWEPQLQELPPAAVVGGRYVVLSSQTAPLLAIEVVAVSGNRVVWRWADEKRERSLNVTKWNESAHELSLQSVKAPSE